MKLLRLIEQHDRFQLPAGLALNFGDSYLLTHNRFFANVRKAVLNADYTFSSAANPAYEALPLSQLESVLAQKSIPYSDNVSVLREVESKISAGALWDDVSDGLKKNHVFHESCHGVARGMSAHLPAPATASDTVLHFMLEESFANTCELLAVSEAHDQYHRIFFEWNSYTCLFEERTQFKKALSEMGDAVIFKFFLLCYVHANLLREGLDEKAFSRNVQLAADSSLSAPQLKTLRALGKLAFTLNPRFRDVTSGFYLKLCGIQTPRAKLFAFDFMGKLEAEPYRKHLGKLAQIATHA